jgi:FtsP/CotA-like multicopper oxidase with cupredoxin domain
MRSTRCWIVLGGLVSLCTATAMAQSFRVQCPRSTITHPSALHDNNSEPAYTGPTTLTTDPRGFLAPSANVNGAIRCQQISGGDGYAVMGDGTQEYMFSFGPLSGLSTIALGNPDGAYGRGSGAVFPNVFNTPYDPVKNPPLRPGDPATTVGAPSTPLGGLTAAQLAPVTTFYNGAIGLAPDVPNLESVFDIFIGAPTYYRPPAGFSTTPRTVTVVTNSPVGLAVGDKFVLTVYDADTPSTVLVYSNSSHAPDSSGQPIPSGPLNPPTWTVSAVNVPNIWFPPSYAFQFVPDGWPVINAPLSSCPADGCLPPGAYQYLEGKLADYLTEVPPFAPEVGGTVSIPSQVDGHVDPRQIMDVGIMNGNIPAPLMVFDEDDEFFLTLTNTGMIMRPDLFEKHTVHFHGYPNASSFYDGVPDASVAINIGASFTYYYLAPDAGTYFWHCHITPPEHLQMGMVGQLYVRPRQNRVPSGTDLYAARTLQDQDLRTACISVNDILCSNPLPAVPAGVSTTVPRAATGNYAYNDGDGSTYYDVEYPLAIHGFDPNFHFVGMTFNPEGFTDMKDKHFLLNGRSYPDTVTPGPLQTTSTDKAHHFSQPLPSIINIPAGKRALLRIMSLDVSEYQTLASLGIPMQVVGFNAKLVRDQAGNNLYYTTNSITLGGGESLDVILDTCLARPAVGTTTLTDYTKCTTPMPAGTYYLYTPNLDHLSNDAENFGGLMTEVRVN